ncbi:MAG: DMT family transporter [Lachnospiraceae bacterium]|nr:DMT family transporter [Lachnospiraceae bacterium]
MQRKQAGENKKAILYAVLAAAFYAISSPCSKLLLRHISSAMMAGFLYLGAGIGMFLLTAFQVTVRKKSMNDERLTKKELPYTIAMVGLDILAPIFLMIGLKKSSAANVSLLNNFEIVATTLIALFLFHEAVSKRLWAAIGLITVSSILLSVEGIESFQFSYGSIFVLLACICWGFENNCTRMIAGKSPSQIVIIKGIGSGIGSLMIALTIGDQFPKPTYMLAALLLGFVAYGLSVFFYVLAQRHLGASKTSAYYAIAPFIGVVLSFLILYEMPNLSFVIATVIMIAGTWLVSKEEA